MGESQHQAAASSRLGIRNSPSIGGGEIVEVQGGHIVRSTGRKDRHSKVCTAKGTRDRRVRLAAHTAIQFYDVQDRLGYDRPSKAVDWLIDKAKAAIDELDELPPWNPTDSLISAAKLKSSRNKKQQEQQEQQQQEHQQHHNQQEHQLQFDIHNLASGSGRTGNSRRRTMVVGSNVQELQDLQMGDNHHSNINGSGFLPPSLDSDSIADTIKSFFPMGASTEMPASSLQLLQSYPAPPELLSRTSSHSQDLRLSLQSFQDPPMIMQQRNHQQQQQHHQQTEPVLFSGSGNPLGFDGSGTTGWEQQQNQAAAEMERFQRMMAWNSGAAAAATETRRSSGGGGGGGGFVFASPQPSQLQPFFGQNQLFTTQRGPLQSSYTPSIRAWIDNQPIPNTTNDDHQYHHHYQFSQAVHQSSIPGIAFAPPSGGLSGFRIPARIQGQDEEQHDGISNQPSSASSDSRH